MTDLDNRLLVLALRGVLLRPRLASILCIVIVRFSLAVVRDFLIVILVIKLPLVAIFLVLLKLQGLASEPVDGTRNELFFDVLTCERSVNSYAVADRLFLPS